MYCLPAAFRRLCVETSNFLLKTYMYSPAAFRRLCVETGSWAVCVAVWGPAAFRRLCVETVSACSAPKPPNQPPLGGCVLKQGRGKYHEELDYQPPLGGCVLKQIMLLP